MSSPKRKSQVLGVWMQSKQEICYKREGEKDNSLRNRGMSIIMTMVDYEVMTSKRDFDDMLEGIDKRHFSRRLELSLGSHWPSSSWPDFSFKALGRTSSFDSPRGRRALSSWQDLSLTQTKRPLGFHKKAMHLSWSSLVFSQMRIGKWLPEHAILIDYLCQMNSIP
jgi:hypothetical protein